MNPLWIFRVGSLSSIVGVPGELGEPKVLDLYLRVTVVPWYWLLCDTYCGDGRYLLGKMNWFPSLMKCVLTLRANLGTSVFVRFWQVLEFQHKVALLTCWFNMVLRRLTPRHEPQQL